MVHKKIFINADGGSRGNPGPAASAFAVLIKGKEIYNESRFLGKATNNVAEYNAVLMAYKWLANYSDKKRYSKIIFFLDGALINCAIVS